MTGIQPGVPDAVRAAAAHLIERQRPDGSWWEWDLPPGPSGPWVTAYVASRLPPDAEGADAARARAARWLLEHQAKGGGWGYNDYTGADADSTAHTILFLAAADAEVPESAHLRLSAFQRPDGAFATYDSGDGLGSWGRAHPDVTPVAALALMSSASASDDAIARAIVAIRRGRRSDSLWNAFWWRTPLYATAWSLAALRAAGARIDASATRQGLDSVRAAGAFEHALRLECLVELDTTDGHTARGLAAGALPDGSWPSTPVLRITRRDRAAPWDDPDPGPLFADPGRVFTTATVLGALVRGARSARR
jgi:hypothetical protein